MSNRFKVHEHFNGFSVEDTVTGKQHWLSDGVDVLFDENEEAISPGTDGFCEKWAETLNASEGEVLEAYFPEEADKD